MLGTLWFLEALAKLSFKLSNLSSCQNSGPSVIFYPVPLRQPKHTTSVTHTPHTKHIARPCLDLGVVVTLTTAQLRTARGRMSFQCQVASVCLRKQRVLCLCKSGEGKTFIQIARKGCCVKKFVEPWSCCIKNLKDFSLKQYAHPTASTKR